MIKMYEIGNVIRFTYNGVERWVRIEAIKTGYMYLGLVGPVARLITGWDYQANYPTGGYRTFKTEKIENIELVRTTH